MKYLNKRDEFLKNYNNILNIKKDYIPNESINEENDNAGPFSNDIGWGDSLLGRLINSAIRKAKIGANLIRIKAVEQRLRDSMDELLLNTSVAELDENDKKLYAKALITTYLIALQEGVEKGSSMDELKSLTETAISAVESNEDLEDKNELLRQLNEWSKFLNEFKEEEEVQEEGQEEGQEEIQNSEEIMDATEAQFGNFKYLFNMLLIFKGIETERIDYNKNRTVTTGTGTSGVAGTSGTSGGVGTSGTSGVQDAQAQDVQGAAQGGVNVGKKTVVTNDKVSLLKYDEFKKINEVIGKAVGGVVGKVFKFITGGKDERKLDKETENLWNSLDQVYKVFTQAGEGDILSKDSEFHRFLKLTPEQIEGDPKLRLTYNRYKTNISKIYSFVRSSNGITEGVDDILGKSEDMGKKISMLYSVTKTKPDGSFPQYPGTIGEVWDELVENIEGFNKYMKNVLDVESKWKVGDTVSWKSDKTGNTISQDILRIDGKKLVFKDKKGEEYTKFMSEVEKVEESMNEDLNTPQSQEESQPQAQPQGQPQSQKEGQPQKEEKNGEVSGWKNPNSVTRIQDWWGKKMDLKAWMLEKTEFEKVRINLDKKLAEKKDSVVINEMDPVLEIVKVFNRAYKLHTTQVIPTGRSGGKVSNQTFMEYHCFGNGTPANAGEQGGPYRNNSIFNQWEDCVNDVKKDKRYQCIFNVGTRIKVGNEYIEKAGMNLRKFMTDMLDGDELYKGGSEKGQGAQAKFLDKYFGYKADPEGKDTYYGDDKDVVTDVAGKINPIKLATLDSNTALGYDGDLNNLKNTFFSLRLKDKSNNVERTYFFYIQDIKGEIAYLSYSLTSFHMKNYIKSSNGGVKVDDDSSFTVKDEKLNGNPYAIRATTIPLKKLYKNDGAFALSGSIDIRAISKKTEYDRTTQVDKVNNNISNKKYILEDNISFTIMGAKHIIDLKDSKRIKVKESGVSTAMKTYGGYENISAVNDIKNAKIENK